MSALLKLKDEDLERLEYLQDAMKEKSKIDVLRKSLALLEEKVEKEKRVLQWRKAAKLVSKTSKEVNLDFQKNSKIRHES